MSRQIRLALCGLLFLAVLCINGPLGAWHGRIAHEERYQSRADMLLSVLGDLRSFLAKMLWFKADIYHHAIESKGESSFTDTDWVTLARFVTQLDPHFEEAYDTGAYALTRFSPPHFQEAEKFIDEGLRNNPNSYSLRFTKAFSIEFRSKHYLEALPWAFGALQVARGQIEILDALRCLGYSYHAYGVANPAHADWARENEILCWRALLTQIPNDPIADARLHALGSPGMPLPLDQLRPDFTPH
ncbi:MAG: hypothetical protein ACYCW6_31435 [Candidatus Xenobia bacterium]